MHKKSTLTFWKAATKRRTMNMGLGLLGGFKVKCPSCDEEFTTPSSSIVFKRKFRWTIQGETPSGKLDEMFVKVAARPQPIEETELNFLNGKMWIPGKLDWQQMTITAFDVQKMNWTWLESTLHGTEDECPPEKYCNFALKLYDGCGCLIESWNLSEAYVSKINFGDLDYSSSDETTIEMDIRYKKVEYKNNCGPEGKYQYLPPTLGGGGLSSRKVTCPNCKHEFDSGSNPNIVF